MMGNRSLSSSFFAPNKTKIKNSNKNQSRVYCLVTMRLFSQYLNTFMINMNSLWFAFWLSHDFEPHQNGGCIFISDVEVRKMLCSIKILCLFVYFLNAVVNNLLRYMCLAVIFNICFKWTVMMCDLWCWECSWCPQNSGSDFLCLPCSSAQFCPLDYYMIVLIIYCFCVVSVYFHAGC